MKMRMKSTTGVLLLVLLSVLCVVASGREAPPARVGMVDYEIPAEFFEALREGSATQQPNEWFSHAATLVRDYATAALNGATVSPAFGDLSPYYRFIPVYEGSIIPNAGTPLQWEGGCFQQSSAIATSSSSTELTVELLVEKPKDLTCSDFYILFTMENFHVPELFDHGTHTIKWDLSNSSAAEIYDVNTNGIRVFRFISGRTDVLAWVAATADLFIPALVFGPSVPDETAKLNLNFLQEYANVSMPPRDIQVVTLNESDIHSGDFLGVVRLDGLDPMLAFGMGAHTGHTTVALWIDGELYICESTTNSHYWPTNGIQKTPYKQWIQQALAADYQVVHLPLSPQYQAMFNETSAIAWVNEVLGMPYGFHNMLFCWIDTVSNNFPCLPPDFSSQCLHPYLVQGLAGLFDRFVPKIADSMWNQALNMRLKTKDLGTADAVYVANTQYNMSWSDLLNVAEQDEWYYSDGYSMVCDVFVCSVWKHAGLFGDLTDEIQCTEFTNWDAYSLNIFDSNYVRPPQCVTADPDSQFCQLLGKYRMSLPGYNSKTFYPNMAEKCPSEPPSYVRPSNC